MNARELMQDWANRNKRAEWVRPTPGLYTYDPKTSEPVRVTDLAPGQVLLTLAQ